MNTKVSGLGVALQRGYVLRPLPLSSTFCWLVPWPKVLLKTGRKRYYHTRKITNQVDECFDHPELTKTRRDAWA